MIRVMESIGLNIFLYNFFLSKIDTYKIKNQQNIKLIGKKITPKQITLPN
jgi:hypothetical protein